MSTTYLDYNATTPVRPEVIEAMLPYLRTHFGNPSSVHRAGRRAKQGLEEAREQVAALIRARAAEVVFTGGGTESNNLALWGAVRAVERREKHIVTTAIEHSSVLETVRSLAGQGCAVTVLPVDGDGRALRSVGMPSGFHLTVETSGIGRWGMRNVEVATGRTVSQVLQWGRGFNTAETRAVLGWRYGDDSASMGPRF